jgi:hypothetical protein
MTDLIYQIACAIATQEGFFVADSRSQRNHNPGNLRAAPWLANAKVDGGYWQAASDAEGMAGLLHQIALNVARGYSLRRLIAAWAPASDGNNPDVYLKNVAAWCGIGDVDVPLMTLLPALRSSR